MAPPADPLATVEVCAILNTRPNNVSRWVGRGFITPIKKMPGRTGAYLFDPAEVERVRQILTERQAS